MKLSIAAKKILHNDFITVFIFDLIGKAIMAVETIFIIRVLSESDYALYVNATSVAGIVLNVVGTGISIPFVAYSSEQIAKGNKNIYPLYLICNLFVIGITAVGLLLTPAMTKIYQISSLLAVLSLFYGGVQATIKMNQTFFQAYEKYKKSGIILNIKNIVILLITVAIYFTLHSISTVFLIVLAIGGTAASFLIGLIWISKIREKTDFNLKYSLSTFKKLMKESIWLIVYLIIQNFFSSICLIILNQVGTEIDISSYGVATKYFNILMLFLASIQTVLRVKTSKPEFTEDIEYRKKYVYSWIKKAALLAGVVGAAGIVLSPIILPWLNGGKYPLSVGIFQILMIAMALGYVFSVCTVILIGIKKYKTLVILSVISLLIGGFSCYILYEMMGVYSAAVGVVVSNAILNISSFIIVIGDKKNDKNISSSSNI